MFGKNPIEKLDHGDGRTLHVVKGSPWRTIQGEGPYVGHPAAFVRLHGCPLRCTFCDTEFSAPGDPFVSIQVLTDDIKTLRVKLVVITGGEPMRQNIFPLCHMLKLSGFKVQIETAGMFWIDGIYDVADIVCSPKTPTIHPKIREHAVAFKYVISESQNWDFGGPIPITATQPGAQPARLAAPRPGAPVYLSPMDSYDDYINTRNRHLVARLALEHGCIAGIQLHKFLGVD